MNRPDQRVVIVAIAGLLAIAGCQNSSGDSEPEATIALSTVSVVRQDLVESKNVTAVVNYGQQRSVPIPLNNAIVTRSSDAGTIVSLGDPLVYLDERPVWLADGGVPMYRELYRPATNDRDAAGDRITVITGQDVQQLQQFLVDKGFGPDGELVVDSIYGKQTEDAIKALQALTGQPRTGRFVPGDIVFSPEPVRLATDIAAGTMIDAVMVTSPDRQIETTIDPDDRRFFEVGATVDLDYTESASTGTIFSVTADLETESGGPRLRLIITPDQSIPDDATTVVVTATFVKADDVLSVPAGALVALSGGGFAVETTDGHLIAVEVGAQAQGFIEVTGNVEDGQEILAPA